MKPFFLNAFLSAGVLFQMNQLHIAGGFQLFLQDGAD